MVLQIDESILKKTPQCPYEFACLKTEEYPLCPVEGQPIMGSGIYVEAPTEDSYYYTEDFCYYKVSWESNHLCRCHVRSELWTQYQK